MSTCATAPAIPAVRVGVLLVLLFLGIRAHAQVYNLHLVTDNQPDYTDFPSFVESSTGTWSTPEEKSIAVWHWGRRSRHQLSCSREGTRYIMDPILNYNSYGALNCGIISALNLCSWLELGYQARYVQLGDHTVSQVSWDGSKSWHLFDSSMSVFCYNHAGQVASCEEIKEAHGCELSGGRVEPGHYYLYHAAPQCASHTGLTGWRCASDNPVEFNRTLGEGASSYTDGFSVDEGCQFARFGHRYILNLRPFESYTRSWVAADNGHLSGTNKSLDCYRPLPDGREPDGQNGPCTLRANGLWIFEPDFGDRRCEKVFYDSAGVKLSKTGPKLQPSSPGHASWVVYQISAANVITSMRVDAEGLCQSPGGLLRISVSRNAGIRWQEAWHASQPGAQSVHLKLRDEVAGGAFCWVRVEMLAPDKPASVGLNTLRLSTTTLLNRLTLPSLTLGSNQVLLRADEQAETVELWPFLHAGLYKDSVFAEDNVYSDELPDGMYKATLGSAVNNKECSATWRLQVPSDITDVSYTTISTIRGGKHWVSLHHSWDGMRFDEYFHLDKEGFPLDRRTARLFSGAEVPAGAREAYFRAAFFSPSGASSYNMAGIQDLLIRIHRKPRVNGFRPFEVTYHWTEHRESGDVTRYHSESVNELPHRYVLNVAGKRDPTMNWVRINYPGYSPEKKRAIYGYSDHQDVGPGCEYQKVSYRWGKDIAQGKPYTASRPASETSGNIDTNGRELTDGIIIAPTVYMATKAVQPATAFWDAGEPVAFVVDLGSEQQLQGVRVSTHQPNERFCHPASVLVEASSDREHWQAAGLLRHDDLFKPPGDYEPWELDDHPQYASLPAGGRLAYSFPLAFPRALSARYVRFTFTPLAGKGVGISELQVFAEVWAKPWPAEIKLLEHSPRPSL
jgi:hypothetical protein